MGGHVGIEGCGREMEKVVEGEERPGSDRGVTRRRGWRRPLGRNYKKKI